MKLTKRFAANGELLKELMDLCTKSIYTNGSIICLKAFIGLANTPMDSKTQYEQLVTSVLSSLGTTATNRSPREVFTFPGTSDSGVGLFGRRSLPKDGFCFCGSLWIERNKHPQEPSSEKMTVFKFGASRTKEIELFLKNGHLHYQVNCG